METNALSPLVVIKQKELELADRLAQAKQAAERALLEARQRAADDRDQAEREGQQEAAAWYESELAVCEAEAEEIRAEGERAARAIAEHGARSLNQAVQLILEIVLPETGEDPASAVRGDR